MTFAVVARGVTLRRAGLCLRSVDPYGVLGAAFPTRRCWASAYSRPALQDLRARRPVELEAILGALLERAAAVAMPLPTLAGVLALARMHSRHAGLRVS